MREGEQGCGRESKVAGGRARLWEGEQGCGRESKVAGGRARWREGEQGGGRESKRVPAPVSDEPARHRELEDTLHAELLAEKKPAALRGVANKRSCQPLRPLGSCRAESSKFTSESTSDCVHFIHGPQHKRRKTSLNGAKLLLAIIRSHTECYSTSSRCCGRPCSCSSAWQS